MAKGRKKKEDSLDYEPENKFTDLVNEESGAEAINLSELAKEKEKEKEEEDTDDLADTDVDFGYIEDDDDEEDEDSFH